MKVYKAAMVGFGLAAAATTAGIAQQSGMGDRGAYFFGSGGQMANGRLSDKAMSEMTKTAKPLEGGVVIFMSGGKLYMAEDPKGTLYQQSRDMMTQGGG